MQVLVAASVTFAPPAAHRTAYTPEMRRALSPVATEKYAEQLAHSSALEGTSQDCAMRRLALEMSVKLQPRLKGSREVFDALQLEQLCGDAPPVVTGAPMPAFEAAAGSVLYVAAADGDDSNAGTKAAPLATVHYAVARIRTLPAPRTIFLLKGVHYLERTVNLTREDGGLTLANAPGEEAWLSGGKPLPRSLAWKRLPRSGNVWQAQLPADFGPVPALHAILPDGTTVEQPRARHPNKNPADGTMEHSLWSPQGSVWTKPAPWAKPARTVWL